MSSPEPRKPAPTPPPSAATPADPPTAVVKRGVELPPELRAKVAERQVQSRLIAEIKGATWSSELGADAIRAVATWAEQNDVEPVTEINVLGGNIYINARHYERKLGELVALGLVTAWTREWIHADARLDQLAAAADQQAADEKRRRQFERIMHAVDETADFACKFSIWYKGLEQPSIGVKQHIPGRKRTIKKKDGGTFQVDADPVGDQFPMETIETRSIRRAMLKLRGSFPPGFRIATRDDDSIELAEVVQISHAQAKADAKIDAAIGGRQLQQLNAGDPYVVGAAKPESAPAVLTPPAGEPWDEEQVRREEREMLERERGRA